MQFAQEPFLTSSEVAKQLRVTVVSLDRWRKSGKIKSYKAGGRIRFKQSDVEAFLRQSTSPQTTNS